MLRKNGLLWQDGPTLGTFVGSVFFHVREVVIEDKVIVE